VHITDSDSDLLRIAAEQGRISALAADCQRDLIKCEQEYPGLFPRAFDARLYSSVTLANAFGAPWATADELRMANRATLWIFAIDWVIDYVASSREEIDATAERCMDIVGGAPPADDDMLGRFLADIRDELAEVPAFPRLRERWGGQVELYLRGVTREWEWKTAHSRSGAPLPSFEEYLANADNFGSTFVNLSHWIATGDRWTHDNLDELWVISEEIQRILRLLNDLATYQRDVEWGDLNALMLGVDRDHVTRRIADLVENCRRLIAPVRERNPLQAEYLERQIGWSTGFYGMTDFWGPL